MMPNRHVLDRLELLIDGELAPDDEHVVRAHLAQCAGCRHSYQMALAIPAHLGPAADPEAPSDLLESVMARVAKRRRRGVTVLLAAAISAVATVGMGLTVLAGPAGIASLLPGRILSDIPMAASPESSRHPEVAGVPALGQFQPLPAPVPSVTKSPENEPQRPVAQASPEPSSSPSPNASAMPSPDASPTPSPSPSPTPTPSPTPSPTPTPTPTPCLDQGTGPGSSSTYGSPPLPVPTGLPGRKVAGQVVHGGCPVPTEPSPPTG